MKKEELLLELEKRFKKDQELLGNNEKEYLINAKNNSQWIKKVISELGWPSEEQFGERTELLSWLIVQHSDDLDFQKHCLKLMKSLPKNKERTKSIEFLTDKILVKEGKSQIYGTQRNNQFT